MVSRVLLLSILLVCVGAFLYLLNLVDAAQICVLAGLVVFITSGILSKRQSELSNPKENE